MRLGIFGGSFDPVHRGHLVLAECCCKQAKLDEVWFVPTAKQPLKPAGPEAGNKHRLAMLKLACKANPRFKICTLELDRGGVSYTIDTLEAIHAEQPKAKLYFLMGADSLQDLPTWHQPKEICRLATPLVVHRAGTAAPDFDVLSSLVLPAQLDEFRQQLVEMPPEPVSSSQIRARIAQGKPWRELVPSAVAEYIAEHQLYARP